MLHFLYTVNRSIRRNSHGTVNLWRIKRNVPELVGRYAFQFESEFQAIINACEELKALPKVWTRCSPKTGCHAYSATELEEHGVATFHNLGS